MGVVPQAQANVLAVNQAVIAELDRLGRLADQRRRLDECESVARALRAQRLHRRLEAPGEAGSRRLRSARYGDRKRGFLGLKPGARAVRPDQR